MRLSSIRKQFSITLAFLMLLSLLGGCRSAGVGKSVPTNTASIPTTAKPTAPTTVPTTAPQPPRYDPLEVPPEVTQKDISRFYGWAKVEQTTETELCFFGVFDDSYAVLVRDTANPREPYSETVNGLTFYYPDGYPIMWGKGHLWQKFSVQKITEDQLQEIYDNYYSAYPELLNLANGQLDFGLEEMEAFSQALLELTGEEVDWDDVNTQPGSPRQRLVYYCTVMGMHVVRWIPEIRCGLITIKYIDVGPYSFGDTEYMQLYVFDGKELLTLADAYERGIFTDAQLEIIYRYHVTSSAH
jgi:hypothetical protein